MCLDKVITTRERRLGKMSKSTCIRYKVVVGRFETPFKYCYVGKRWKEATMENYYGRYLLGFHVFKTKKGAKSWLKSRVSWMDGRNFKIIKVECAGLLAQGYEYPRTIHKGKVRVDVYQWMRRISDDIEEIIFKRRYE